MRAGEPCAFVFVVASLMVSGGTLEIVKLARDLAGRGHPVRIVAMWRSPHPVDTADVPVQLLCGAAFRRWSAIRQLPGILLRFAAAKRSPGERVVLSHYSTFPLGSVVPRAQRWFFIQDAEWNFVGPGRRRDAIRRYILVSLRRGQVVTANRYLTDVMRKEGVAVAARVDIWADPAFAGRRGQTRDIDVVTVLRPGANKRSDLQLALLARLRERHPALRVAVITPDRALLDQAGGVAAGLLRPDRSAMRAIYERARIFVLLSDHEGFGLPPLEAMGSGCVPICRDAGGTGCYMTGPLMANVVPATEHIEAIVERICALIADAPRWHALSQAAAGIFDQGLSTVAGRLDGPDAARFVR